MRFTPLQSPAPREGGGGANQQETSYTQWAAEGSDLRLVGAHDDARSETTSREATAARKRHGQRYGLYLWQEVVRAAKLTSTQKLICYTLLCYIDHKTGIGFPAIETIADDCGLDPRTVQRNLSPLFQQGVVEKLTAGRGGFSQSGRGISTTVRLNLDRLRSLNPGNTPGLKGGNTSVEPRHCVPQTPALRPEKGGVMPPKHTNEQTKEHTTTTTSDGGGGGGAALRSGGVEDQASEQKTSEQILVGAGVLRTTARELAASIDPAVIAAGPNWLDRHGKNADNPPGVLVTALRDGTVELWFAGEVQARRDREARERVERLELNRPSRVAAYQRIAKRIADETPPEKVAAIGRAWDEILQVWPTKEALADAEIIPDAQLLDESLRPGDLMKVVHKHARALLAGRAAVSDVDGGPVAPPTVSPHPHEGEDAANQQIKDPIQ